MKYIILLILFFFNYNILLSQSASVEKSTTGIQVGLIGIWAHNEYKLTNQIVLRSESGFSFSPIKQFWSSTRANLSIEPRWYFNFKKRIKYHRNIKNNSGSFLGLFNNLVFVPAGKNSSYSITPVFGLRRNYWDHFTFEFRAGYSWEFIFPSTSSYDYPFLDLRLGYTF